MKQINIWVLVLLCLAMLCSAASAATLFIDPVSTELGMGESVELAVMVEDVQHLGSYDIDVTWDPVLVSLSEVSAGPRITSLENNIQSGEVQIVGVCNTLEGISETSALCYLTFTSIKENGDTSPIAITVNNYGFLNSTTGADIPVETPTDGSITVLASSVVDARIALANRQVPFDKETTIRASVANQRDYATAALDINVTISKGGNVVNTTMYSGEIIRPGDTFSREILWTPGTGGTYLVKINVTSDDPVRGRPTDQKSVTAIDYELSYTNDIVYGQDRVQTDSWFYDSVYVTTNKVGPVDVHIDAPDSFAIYGGENQTAYFYNNNWNRLYIRMRSDEPGRYTADQFTFNISANGKADSVHGKDITIYVPSIEVTSVNTARIADGATEKMRFNTLHTNNTHQNETVLIAQSGAQGRTLSGLGYLVGYPYGCVEQTTCKMLASMNVKNYYLGRDDRPANFDSIRERANESVIRGINSLVRDGTRGQNSDGGWSLWGGDPSESSSSSYASYTLAKINQTDEDLNHLLVDKISYNDTVEIGTVNFDKLIQWFNENHDTSEGTWSWSAPVCHSWTPESNTAFVMLIHDMINQSADVKQPYRGYMEENMQNATRYIIDNQEPGGAFSGGDDAAMATALGLWGLEVFGLPSDTIDQADIDDAKVKAEAYLTGAQNGDGSWSAATRYGWYQKGRTTESTAYAILALNATGMENDDPHIANGVGWLVDTYENSGSWGYTWASQAAIDALIVCQGTEISTGTVKVLIDGNEVHTFVMDSTNPREEYTLNADQMAAMMAVEDQEERDIFDDGFSIVKWHDVEVQLTGDGPIVLSVENSQWAPLNEIDNTIRNTRTIQMDGVEEDVFIPQFNTNIDVLAGAEYDVGGFTISFEPDPSTMVVDTAVDVTIGAISDADLFSPMIEVPIAGFTFDNTSTITDSEGDTVSYEVLNSTANIGQDSIFIEPESWVQDDAYSYTFEIVPENYGILNMSLRVIPLYDESNVAVTSHTFDVTGTGNVTIHVQDEDYVPVTADSITVNGVTVNGKSSWDFTDLLEDTYPFSVSEADYPDVHGNVTVTYGETVVYYVTLPTTMDEPVLILSEGGSGSIAGVAKIPGELNAENPEETTFNVSLMGDGGELGVALEFPMRYLFTDPIVTLNGVVLGLDDYDLSPGTFEYGLGGTYTTTNSTLVVYNATSGTNYIGMEFDGCVWGDASGDGVVDVFDSLYILHFVVGNIPGFDTYSYPDVYERNLQKIDVFDSLVIKHRIVRNINEYYQLG